MVTKRNYCRAILDSSYSHPSVVPCSRTALVTVAVNDNKPIWVRYVLWVIAEMVGLQTELERERVWQHQQHSSAIDDDLDSGHTALQQASASVCLLRVSVCLSVCQGQYTRVSTPLSWLESYVQVESSRFGSKSPPNFCAQLTTRTQFCSI